MSVLRLFPAIKNYIWGGGRLKESYGKIGALPLAESWELSFHPDGLTQRADGASLKDVLTAEQLGDNCKDFADFPLLVKWIDAERSLSVQVHPSDEDALRYENSYGKTEMWYVVAANEGAGLYLGFRRTVTEKEVADATHNGTLTELLNFVPVKAGDVYFIPSGTVHAIGAGCLILEIQQNSNITYRLFDYGRRDAEGKLRPLHVNEALRVLKKGVYTPIAPFLPTEGEKTLGISRYFHTSHISVPQKDTLHVDEASFTALFCIGGSGRVGETSVSQGDSLFLTAGTGEVSLSGDMSLVAVTVRRYHVDVRKSKDGFSAVLYDDIGRHHAQKSVTAAECAGKEEKFVRDALVADLLSAYAMTENDVVRKDVTETC